MTDEEFVQIVIDLDARIAEVEGHGFAPTPGSRNSRLAAELGVADVIVKDETGNVAGSHKSRHLMGTALWLRVVERLELAEVSSRQLAIASCGNAALAAAVMAKALEMSLTVYVPAEADPRVLERLGELGASVETCVRMDDWAGDPCMQEMRSAVSAGALPFTCQASENALMIEGAQTLVHELVDQVQAGIDRVVVQVGGGALMTAVVRGFAIERELGRLVKRPRFHAVQTTGAHPLERALARVRDRADEGTVAEAMTWACSRRSEVMWPWEQAPSSIARGILDDETYDWYEPVAAMLETGGSVIVVADAELERACALVRSATGVEVDATGAAGFAGLLALAKAGDLDPGERVLVLLTGGKQ